MRLKTPLSTPATPINIARRPRRAMLIALALAALPIGCAAPSGQTEHAQNADITPEKIKPGGDGAKGGQEKGREAEALVGAERAALLRAEGLGCAAARAEHDSFGGSGDQSYCEDLAALVEVGNAALKGVAPPPLELPGDEGGRERARQEAAAARRAAKGTLESPRHLDRIRARFGMTPAELERLDREGVVVLDKARYESFGQAYHEIYQSELPVFITADSLLHAAFDSSQASIMAIERGLSGRVAVALERAHEALGRRAGAYPPEVAAGADLYLTVARWLLKGEPVDSAIGADPRRAAALVEAIEAADSLAEIDLFGRARVVDFSQYKVRGHYAHDEGALASWFKAGMWLSRLEFNVVSRSCRSSQPGVNPNPEETPVEALAALAVAEGFEAAGALGELDAIDGVWRGMVGPREDISARGLLALRDEAGLKAEGALKAPGAFERLKAAVGDRFERTAIWTYMPEGTGALPVVATLLGPGVTPDTGAVERLVHDALPGRYALEPADIGLILGHEGARRHLAFKDAAYDKQLREARAHFERHLPGDDLYRIRLRGLRSLAEVPEGQAPSFVRREAYADMRLNSALVGYGQLRHNNLLMAVQPMDFGGCAIPEGYVEPAPGLLAALSEHAARFESMTRAVACPSPCDASSGQPWQAQVFRRQAYIFKLLSRLIDAQLKGAPAGEAEWRFFNQIAEVHPAGTDSPAHYSGWYFMLFDNWSSPEGAGALRSSAFIADHYTSVNEGTVAYLGASGVQMAVFLVDAGGDPRAMVGPVARGLSHTGPLSRRLGDGDLEGLETGPAPWSVGYTAVNGKDPGLRFFSDPMGYWCRGAKILTWAQIEAMPQAQRPKEEERCAVIGVRSPRALGPVEVRFVDHHRDQTHTMRLDVKAGERLVRVQPPPLDEYGSDRGECAQIFVPKAGYWAERCADAMDAGFSGASLDILAEPIQYEEP